jgi:hypothetical protein
MRKMVRPVKNNTVALFCLLAFSVTLTGCGYFKLTVGQPLGNKADQFKEGKTSFGSVMEVFGPPEVVSQLPSGFAYLYEYHQKKEAQIGVSVQNYFKVGAAIANGRFETLVLTFDDRGVLLAKQTKLVSKKVGRSAYLQLIFVSKSGFAVDKYAVVSPQHTWGMSLFMPLPEALNAGQDLDSGANGLEQSGTPAGAGQNSMVNAYSEGDIVPRR